MKIMTNQQGIGHIAVIAVVAVIGVSGLVGWRVLNASKTQNSEQSAVEQQTQVSQLPENIGDIKPLEEITAQVTAADASGQVTNVSLENEDGTLVYKIQLQDGRVLVFDARKGNRLADAKQEKANDNAALPANFAPGITIATAIQTAKASNPGKVVQKVEVEKEDGVIVISIRFTDGSRVDVQSGNGTVVKTVPAPARSSSSNGGGSAAGSSDDSSDSDSAASGDDQSDDSADSQDDADDNDDGEDGEDSNDDNDDDGGSNSGSSGSGSGSSGSGR